jgi:hypothetical protein
MTFWYALSLLAFVGILGHGERGDYLRFGLFSGAALGTKEGIIGAYVLVGLSIIWVHLGLPGSTRSSPSPSGQESDGDGRDGPGTVRSRIARLVDARMRALVFGLLFVYILSTNAIFNYAGFVDHWRQWLPGNERMDGFREQVDGWTPVFVGLWRSLANGLGLPLLLLCLAGIVVAVAGLWTGRASLGAAATEPGAGSTKRDPAGRGAEAAGLEAVDPEVGACEPGGAIASPLWLLVPLISYIAFTILPARMAQIRLVLPMVPSLVVFGAVAAERLLKGSSRRRRLGQAVLILALAHAGVLSIRHDFLFVMDARYEAEAWLLAELPEGTDLLYFSDVRYLPRFEALGFKAERLPQDADFRSELDSRKPPILLLSSRWYTRYDKGVNADPEKQRLIRELREGRGDYEIAWHSRARSRPWWRDIPDEAKASPSVDPEIFILRRRP